MHLLAKIVFLVNYAWLSNDFDLNFMFMFYPRFLHPFHMLFNQVVLDINAIGDGPEVNGFRLLSQEAQLFFNTSYGYKADS